MVQESKPKRLQYDKLSNFTLLK